LQQAKPAANHTVDDCCDSLDIVRQDISLREPAVLTLPLCGLQAVSSFTVVKNEDDDSVNAHGS
jgi:hypothetical protein